MDKQQLNALRGEVVQTLHQNAAFWLAHGMDRENGGVYTCLDLEGKVYSTDKSVWMQGRCAWMYSALCARYGVKQEWLDAAKSCLDFLENHCVNQVAGGRLYFAVTAGGKPLRQRRYCFAEAFYCMANAEYYAITGDAACLARARAAYELVYKLNNGLMADPTGLGPKTVAETRTGRALADPMIYLNVSSVLRRCDPEQAGLYTARANEAVEQILSLHHKPDLRATLESVGPKGEFRADISAGRVVNPGHSLECSWFLLEHAEALNKPEVLEKALEVYDFALEQGWDGEYGGLLYYTDVLGRPPEAYEHDMKLWWPHNEMLIASLMAHRLTGQQRFLDWFEKGWAYAQKVFPVGDTGEWYGYLRRDGKPTQPAAIGSSFKGPFHLPRMLLYLDMQLERLTETRE